MSSERISLMAVIQLTAFLSLCHGAMMPTGDRKEISLDGTWEIAEGTLNEIPTVFDHKIPVPGLADLALPAFKKVGIHPASQDGSGNVRQAFWYRRDFRIDGKLPGKALLKINKAMYGTKVYINGSAVGECNYCFTPAWFDIRKYLKPSGQNNEIIVRIGVHWSLVPPDVARGLDNEKSMYVPGIYDSVKLVLADGPLIRNVQIAPDIDKKAARIVAAVDNAVKADRVNLSYRIREAVSRKLVAKGKASKQGASGSEEAAVDFTVDMKKCRLWSPEDPFLYELELTTDGDGVSTRFGMRTFRMDADTGRAILNGKPYYMRGSNVCIFRFFEDRDRKDLPWRDEWVREFHQKVKDMNWNSLRYCIGFPPEKWYDIADELGILIQDEFPIWSLNQQAFTEDKLAEEYRQWMEERWNHPCVVIWDAQNETHTKITGGAREKVRYLDLSNRPWDNGESAPGRVSDTIEAHPYKFTLLKKEENKTGWKSPCDPRNPYSAPFRGGVDMKLCEKNPMIINEYGWVWLLRNGEPSIISRQSAIFRGIESVEERRYLAARALAAKSEYWRSHRQCAGVLHFCALSCSVNLVGGSNYTSDNFVTLDPLTFEPHFEELVRSAFAPVGVMVDFWETTVEPGSKQSVKVALINDLYKDWKGKVKLTVELAGKPVRETELNAEVRSLGRTELKMDIEVPEKPGNYLLIAKINGHGNKTVRSIRDLVVLETGLDKKTWKATDNQEGADSGRSRFATDGSPWTFWHTIPSHQPLPQSLTIDMGAEHELTGFLYMPRQDGCASGNVTHYIVAVSTDGKAWNDVAQGEFGNIAAANPIQQKIVFKEPVKARHVKFTATSGLDGCACVAEIGVIGK